MEFEFKGKVYCCKDNIDTDQIIPAKYLVHTDRETLGKFAMSGMDGQFSLKPHEIIVAGENFGCGSSREHAVVCLQGAGVKAVIAKSFARIFYRNAINLALPVVELTEAEQLGEEVEVDLLKGTVESKGKEFKVAPYPEHIRKIFEAGGMVEMIRSLFLCRKKDHKKTRSSDCSGNPPGAP